MTTAPSLAKLLPEHTDVAILGAGPIGLDAALAMAEAGRPFVLLESGARPAAGIRSWGAVRLFTPWSMNLSQRMREALDHKAPDTDACPTGDELCDQALNRIASCPAIAPRCFTETRALAVGRDGLLKREEIGTERRAERLFRLLLQTPNGERVLYATTVLDCTGSHHTPNWFGHGGIPAAGERLLAEQDDGRLIRTIGQFLEVRDWQGQRVLLVGAGHSAQTAAVTLAGSADRVHWVLRGNGENLAAIEGDPLPERSALHLRARQFLDGANTNVTAHRNTSVESLHSNNDDGSITVRLRSSAARPASAHNGGAHSEYAQECTVNRIVALVGSIGDQQLYRELQVQECYATGGPMRLAAALLGEGERTGGDHASNTDCLAQVSQGPETLLTPEPGYFILGNKSYGRNNAFLLRIGYQQVDDVLTLI